MRRRQDPRAHYPEEVSTRPWQPPSAHAASEMDSNVTLDCGWGRLIFGQTFADQETLAKTMAQEAEGERDIALYLHDPHVLVAMAPDKLFIDPSLTYRLWFHHYRPRRQPTRGVVVRKMRTQADAEAVNRLYAANGMVTAPPEMMWANQRTRTFTYLVAEDSETGQIVGTVTGIDHIKAFNDPERGASLWCLAVDPQGARPGVGEALTRTLAERYQGVNRAFLDLSVMHDNAGAIRLYEKLGFVRVPVFLVKAKNPINEPLFTAAQPTEKLNPYAKIIADEARRRGITVNVLDAEWGEMDLSHAGVTVRTRESLSELTTAVAMSRCDDKRITRRVLERAGLRVPRGQVAGSPQANADFLNELGELVVKPARGEQGNGVTVGVKDSEALEAAIERARRFCPDVLLEERAQGEDLRVIVIGGEVVAAAMRMPATVIGTGKHTVEQLIKHQSRRRETATGGESSIPLDSQTKDVVAEAGYALDDVLASGENLQVRKTANLHTGGTIHDATDDLHPDVVDASLTAAEAIDIPVVGLDFLVPEASSNDYMFIEANERPGLANHEPAPTASKFVDLLFPTTKSTTEDAGTRSWGATP